MDRIQGTQASGRRRGSGRARSATVALVALAVLVSTGAAHAEYTVQSGDTLDSIAQRHGTTVAELRAENELADPNRIVAGATISLPARSLPARSGGGGATAHHVVSAGETLSAIASRHGIAAAQLAEWNGLASMHQVMAGQRLSLTGPAAPDVAATGGGTHRVAAGESLSGIAHRLGVSVDELARANGIGDPNQIVAGMALTVPGAGGGWQCPVRGPATFVNDYGVMKPSGRFHNGVDVYAPRGTPVVAPVAGHVQQVTGSRAGLQFTLSGVDGNVYIGTHLDSFGAAGQVQAGQTLGTVGNTGNARGTPPHLHFEIHEDGERIINPYPTLRAACG